MDSTQAEIQEKPKKQPRSASGFRECKTFREKVEHFWEYYRWHALAAVTVLAIIVTSVVQALTAVEPDLKIICYTSNAIRTEDMAFLQEQFQKELSGDINGDGERNVTVLDYSYDSKSNDITYQQAMLQKLQMALAAENTILLYITDSESMKLFENDSFQGVFGEAKQIRTDFLTQPDTSITSIPKELYIQCRQVDGTRLENLEGMQAILEESLRILDIVSAQ